MLSIIFVSLQNGVYIDNISIPHLKIKTLYLKWNEKLNISIKEIHISKKNDKDSKVDYDKLVNSLKNIYLFDSWFENINIDQITYNDLTASFSYKYGQKSYFKAFSSTFSLMGDIISTNKILTVKIKEFKLLNKNLTIDGDLIIDSLKLEAKTFLNININNEIHLKLSANSNQKKLTYRIVSETNIKSIKYAINLLNLNKKLNYWLLDAIDMQNVSLNQFYGWIDYNHIDQAYKNIYANATIHKLNYKYDKKLDSINTNTTDLEFKNGILYIYPKEAYTYRFYLNKSWLKIDFTKKNIFLTLKLKFNAILNKDILFLLNRYKIKLPFLQKKGEITTNLKVVVNLNKITVSANGDFYTKKANFNYLGLNLDVFDTKVFLNNYDVTIDNMVIKYKDIAKTKVNLKLDVKNNKGYINFNVQKLNFKQKKLNLVKPINVVYKLSTKVDIIDVGSSLWKFNNDLFNLNSLSIPFDLKTLSLNIPKTLIKNKKIGSAYITGDTSFKNKILNLDIDLLKFSYKDINLIDPSCKLKLIYKDSNINILSTNKINFMLLDKKTILDKVSIDIKNNILKINSANFYLQDNVSTSIIANYNINNDNGEIDLYNLKIKNKKMGSIFYKKERIKLNVRYINDTTYIRSDEFDLNFIASSKYWKLNTKKLSKLAKKSNLLKKYFIDNGSFSLTKYKDSNTIDFFVKSLYPYDLILIKNIVVNNYHINGHYNIKTDNSSLNINNKIKIDIDKSINIKANHIGINFKQIIKLLSKIKKSKDNSSIKVHLYTNNSYLYINEKRKIISDKINLEYFNHYTTAKLIYKKGSANFILNNNSFNIYGSNFNDIFIENLFSDSKFKGGKLDFYVGGDLNNYSGLLYVRNTTILKYKLLNNILAFVNTIPSLVTFSLPGYNNNGLTVENAYINFNTKDGDKFNIDNVSLDSKEIKIVGKGVADFKRNTINIKLNLKTDLGSTIAKIPVVGYLVLGNDTISSSLEIDGKLDDPKIKTRLANDIVVAPLNIIKRTLLLPIHLMSK